MSRKRYALLNVEFENFDGTVFGSWIQNCTACTFEKACEMAVATVEANSNRITVAVVEDVFGETRPHFHRLPALYIYGGYKNDLRRKNGTKSY